jgi:hypothetical protein
MGRRSNKVVLTCPICKSTFECAHNRYIKAKEIGRRICCCCKHAADLKIKENPDYYKGRSALIKQAYKNPIALKNKSEGMKKSWQNKQTREKHIDSMKEVWTREGYKEHLGKQISVGKKKAFAEGTISLPVGPHGKYVITKKGKGGTILCHGFREILFADILDKLHQVKYYRKDYLRIPYSFGKEACTYYPDFYIKLKNGKVLVVELLNKFADRKTQAQIKVATKYCMHRGWKFKVLYLKNYPDDFLDLDTEIR